MHLVVLRRGYYEKYRFAAMSLFNALNESKEIAYKPMRFLGALQFMLPWLANELDEIEEVFGEDLWPYGVEEQEDFRSAGGVPIEVRDDREDSTC